MSQEVCLKARLLPVSLYISAELKNSFSVFKAEAVIKVPSLRAAVDNFIFCKECQMLNY